MILLVSLGFYIGKGRIARLKHSNAGFVEVADQGDDVIPSTMGSSSVSATARQTREAGEVAQLFNPPVSYQVTSPAANASVCPFLSNNPSYSL